MVKEKKREYNFGEKELEWDSSSKSEIETWLSPKYYESKNKVIEMIESQKYGLKENDFWILKNKTGSGKMAYTGLIISHNGCLKINDSLEDKQKFKPSCVKENQNGYENSLVYTYCNDDQGIYEVGEISQSNYKQTNGRYPYAMAYKRLFDRVVLKNSKLAFAGVYSDSEAEEFKEVISTDEGKIRNGQVTESQKQIIEDIDREVVVEYAKKIGKKTLKEFSWGEAQDLIEQKSVKNEEVF